MLTLVLALICALLVAVFAVQNAKPVAVTFLAWHFEISLVLIILGAAALGAVAAFLLGTIRLVRQGRTVREATQRAQRLESELERLQRAAESKERMELPVQNGETSQ
ncbi:MAG TPA: DUF1049 domain-containing protein [Firmicutes bacterium]|nr:DUF1049 domain-containing protein [Bacillota bacterium]